MTIAHSGLHIRSGRLEERLSGTGPEARFLLEAVLRMAVLGDRWNGKKNDLARRLRLAKKFVSVGVDDLVSAGSLIRRSAETEQKRGRPAISYEVSGEVLDSLKRLESPFSALFDDLFLGPERPFDISQRKSEGFWEEENINGAMRKNPLNACNRLLLAVLLDHSNDVGLVTDVSNSDLQQMTGLNANRVRNRLSILIEQGVIRFHAPGFASARFPGGKIKSSYVLNGQFLKFSANRPKCELYSPDGSHTSRAEWMMFEGKGRGSHIKFKVSKEIMLSVWLLLHRLVALVLSRRRTNAFVELSEDVYELIAATLRAGLSSKADREDFSELCRDLGWWVVDLANRYIDHYSIEGVEEGGQVAVLPYDKHHLILVRVSAQSMDKGS